MRAENAHLVKLLIPLRAKPTDWIFKSPDGKRDQAKLNDAFTAECQRLEISSRGLYWRQRSESAAFRSREARLFERKYLISNR
jgi:hypothetical protein